MPKFNNPNDALRHHVTGAVERGEKEPIVEVPVKPAMDSFTATMIAEGVEEASEEETIAAWQYLHDSGLAYQLQGWFGREAQRLIAAGVIQDCRKAHKPAAAPEGYRVNTILQ